METGLIQFLGEQDPMDGIEVFNATNTKEQKEIIKQNAKIGKLILSSVCDEIKAELTDIDSA